MTPEQARQYVEDALGRVAPDARLRDIPPDADLRDLFELDSLDFLSYVECLSDASGRRIDEDDYPEITTMAGAAGFLARGAP